MFPKFDQKRFLKKAKVGVAQAIASPDHIITQVVSAIDEQNKIANLAYERINEWYGLHFPEFRHREPFKYVQVAAFFDRKSMNEARLREILGDAAQNVIERAKNSVGVEFSDEDLEVLQGQAKLVLGMHEMKEKLEKYQDRICTRLAPNMSELAGSPVAAKLIAASGGVQKLALMPASTIQVLGAEKALFKHLRSGSPSPKHGIIFQHPMISTAPKKARGKIARALAAKLAIAVKADAFTRNSIGAKLKEQFEARAQQILQKAKEQKDEPETPRTNDKGQFGQRERNQNRNWQGGANERRQNYNDRQRGSQNANFGGQAGQNRNNEQRQGGANRQENWHGSGRYQNERRGENFRNGGQNSQGSGRGEQANFGQGRDNSFEKRHKRHARQFRR